MLSPRFSWVNAQMANGKKYFLAASLFFLAAL
jgi:hypothetical protein